MCYKAKIDIPLSKANRFMNIIHVFRKQHKISIRDFANQCGIKLARYSELENFIEPSYEELVKINVVVNRYKSV